MVVGLAAVAAVYMLSSLAFLLVLGFDGIQRSGVAAIALERAIGPWGGQAMSVLICVSALGAVAGQIFAGARIFYAFGREHRSLAKLGVWNARFDSPLRSLAAQGAITLLLVVVFGTPLFSRLMAVNEPAANEGQQAFERLVYFTTPAVWFFYLMVGFALFKLRRNATTDDALDEPRGSTAEPEKRDDGRGPFRTPWFPLIPVVFCLSCAALLQSSVSYAFQNRSYESFLSLGILAMGVVLAMANRFGRRAR